MPGTNGTGKLNEWQTSPLYTLGDAARLARVSPPTIRRWISGYSAVGFEVKPIVPTEPSMDSGVAMVSFLQLAEIVVASKFRRNRLSYDRIRSAREYAKEQLGIDYPFAKLDLEAIGGHIIQRWEKEHPGPSLLVLDSPHQLLFPSVVQKTLQDFDPDENRFAVRWFPMGHEVPIVVDPEYGSGMPTIPQRRVTIETLYKRWQAGYDFRFIASDFKLDPRVVEHALKYHDQIRAA